MISNVLYESLAISVTHFKLSLLYIVLRHYLQDIDKEYAFDSGHSTVDNGFSVD
jgi:hypothetical protein